MVASKDGGSKTVGVGISTISVGSKDGVIVPILSSGVLAVGTAAASRGFRTIFVGEITFIQIVVTTRVSKELSAIPIGM